MKKIILLTLLPLSLLIAGPFIMTKEGSLIKANDTTTTNPGTTTPPADGWVEAPLPTTAFNVLNYGLKGDGVTDDSAALNALASNTSVTNWYFPAGKSFLLSKVKIPSHIKAIFGGATIISKAYVPADSPIGALYIDQPNWNMTGLIVDGLKFTQQNGTWPTEASNTRWYGLFTIMGHTNITNMEIRRCSFDNKYFAMNGIKIMSGYSNSVINGLRIHHNTFTNSHEFPLEFIEGERKADGSSRTAIGIHINDNHFSGANSLGLSFVKVRGGVGNTGEADGTESYVYNNTFAGTKWAMEIGNCSGVRVYGNTATGITGSVLNMGGSTQIETGKNFFYDNDLRSNGAPGVDLLLYNGNNDEFYNNYFDAMIKIEDRGAGRSFDVNFHDNILMQNIGSNVSNHLVRLQSVTGAKFDNNTMYGTSQVSRAFYLDSNSGGSGVSITNNTIKLGKPSGIAIDNTGTPITEYGNTVELGYTGIIPN